MSEKNVDKELEQYRSLLETPTEFEDGFGWTTLIGLLFCGLVMVPGSIYLNLMTGGSITNASTWVTLILFSEIMRRALKPMNKGNLVVLLYGATIVAGAGVGVVAGSGVNTFVFRAYMVASDAARDLGMRDAFPTWFVPKPDSAAIVERNLFHVDWLIPLGLALFMMLIGVLKKYTLGYFFFRLCSDVEKLPFPMAPISAQGTLALAEADKTREQLDQEETLDADGHKVYSKWRIFSLGTVIGICFGVLQIGVPTVTGMFLDKPLFILPQPFLDTTTLTESLLPATPTGMVIDLGVVILGFVLPFWAVVGALAAIVLTLALNPVLQHYGVLTQWQPGMDTINTTFVNGMDYWTSFGIGTAITIALVSVGATVRDVMRRRRESRSRVVQETMDGRASIWVTPKIGRGDYPMWMALIGYILGSSAVVAVCNHLVPGILFFLLFFAFLYNPFISYVNARLLGISGQAVDIPFVREGAFILSGDTTIGIWLAPVPIENYGAQAQNFRINELTGVSFWSLLKCDLIAVPITFFAALLFWGFIWHSSPVPSDLYPAVQKTWALQAKNNTLLYTATFVPPGEDPENFGFANSEFAKAIHPNAIATGAGVTCVLFLVFSGLGLPIMFIYGMIRGFGALPHTMVLEIVGALLGRYYFQKKFGKMNFLRMAPALMAGYATGVGLFGMAAVALNLIKSAVSSLPF